MAEKQTAKKISLEEYFARSQSDRAWYFKNTIKIRPKDSARGLIPLDMRPGQKQLMDAIDKARAAGRAPRIIILKARQIGFSTVTDMEMLRCCHVYPHQQALVVAHRTESTEILFENIRRAWENMPAAVRPENRYSTKRVLHFKGNDSRIEVSVAGETRGFTAQLLHVSELAFIDGAKKLITAIMQTVPDTPDSLVILESTPNGVGNEFHSMWVKACKPGNSNEWIPVFIPWFHEPTYSHAYARVTTEQLEARQDDAAVRAKEIMRLHGVTIEQISWWLDTLENKCFGDLDVMEQEYASDPRSCFLASGRRVFDRDGINYYSTMAGITDDMERPQIRDDPRDYDIEPGDDPKKPKLVQRTGGRLRIYRMPNPRHRYIIAADVSTGDPGSDYTPIVVLNRHTLDIEAVWYGRRPPEVLADIEILLGYLYNEGLLVWEANNHGILFGHRVLERNYTNIYYRKTNEESVSGRVTDKPGFFTSGANREHLFNLLRRYVAEKSGRIEDERLVYEMMTLQYDESDRVDHPEGGSSDLCVATAIAIAVHAGNFESAIVPLTLEQNSAVTSAYNEIVGRRLMGHNIDESLATLDLFGLTIEECDRLQENIERTKKRREKFGMGGMT